MVIEAVELMRICLVILCVIIFSCKNYYNETLHWIDNIPLSTDITKVKACQPSYVIIDWKNPRIYNDSTYAYKIEKIRGSDDVLNMSHYLIFRNNKFLTRQSKK